MEALDGRQRLVNVAVAAAAAAVAPPDVLRVKSENKKTKKKRGSFYSSILRQASTLSHAKKSPKLKNNREDRRTITPALASLTQSILEQKTSLSLKNI